MNKNRLTIALLLASSVLTSSLSQAEEFSRAFTEGKVLGDFRLRYETNDTDDGVNKAADALTLRSRIGFETAPVYGVSVLIEGSNTSAIIDDYSPETAGYDGVADPTHSIVNRLQIAYKKDELSAALGRQRIIFDNSRFVGNVGWRQQEQVYDAMRLGYKIDDVNIQYAFVNKVHTPGFAHNDAAHHLININYSGLDFATVTGYGYLLKDKEAGSGDQKNNTFGARLNGKQELDSIALLYTAEFAAQKTDDNSANYMFAEAGVLVSGMTAVVGFESLGSDSGNYGFQTPLATKHAFNGWADKFGATTPNDGLNDTYIKLATKVADVKLLAVYHDYSADEGSADKGSEIDLQASMDFAKYYSAGIKYAAYSKGDAGLDTDKDKGWLWIEAKF